MLSKEGCWQVEGLLKRTRATKVPTEQAGEQAPISSLQAMLLHEATDLHQLLGRVVQDCLLILRSCCLTASNAGLVASLGCSKVGSLLPGRRSCKCGKSWPGRGRGSVIGYHRVWLGSA